MPLITLAIAALSFFVYGSHTRVPNLPPHETADSLGSIVKLYASDILAALKGKDMAALSVLVHPVKGVRFSPYGFVGKADRTFDTKGIRKLMNNKKIYFWGFYDATHKPIKRIFRDYYKRFVYDRDYQKANFIAVNHIQRTNRDVNVFDEYKNGVVVDYMFTGEAEFMDLGWRALRLVLEEYDDVWYLVGVIHDEWTE